MGPGISRRTKVNSIPVDVLVPWVARSSTAKILCEMMVTLSFVKRMSTNYGVSLSRNCIKCIYIYICLYFMIIQHGKS